MFVTPDLLVRSSGDHRWKLLAPVVYEGRDQAITVPVGFETDFASVPQAVQWLIPVSGRYTRAAIVHDWLCKEGLRSNLMSSHDVDGVFRRIMRESGVPLVRWWLMWTGVRWGALFNPLRRRGWWHDAAMVLMISVLALPLLLPTIPVVFALGVDWLVNQQGDQAEGATEPLADGIARFPAAA